jgi:hypothetical protein
VAIDGQAGHAQRVPEDDIRRLSSHARQRDEVVHRARDFARVAFDHLSRHPDKRSRLRAEEPRRLDLRLELRGRGSRERSRVRIAGKQRRRDLVDALVGTLRRQDRGDQELVGVGEVQLGISIRMLRGERRHDPVRLDRRFGRCGNASWGQISIFPLTSLSGKIEI